MFYTICLLKNRSNNRAGAVTPAESEEDMNEELKSLETVANEIIKVRNKYSAKAEKERARINDVYVTVCGEKCYTEQEINDWYANDYISSTQCDKYIERLDAKKKKAGEKDSRTESEIIVNILNNICNNIYLEIKDIKIKEEQEKKKQERWEIAKQQGMSYKQFLDLEEVNRQSEEYERLMGI